MVNILNASCIKPGVIIGKLKLKDNFGAGHVLTQEDMATIDLR